MPRQLPGTGAWVLVGCLAGATPTFPCTVFNVTEGAATYVGANKDWTTDRFHLRVRRAHGEKHGMLVFGVDDPERYPFFGFNDQGLFFDLASAPHAGEPRLDPGKETWDSPLYVRMLASCGDVTQAVEFLGRFNVTGLRRHHIMLVDRTGLSAVVEAAPQGQVVIRKQGRYQLMTNFLLSAPEAPALSESGRFAVADRMLREMGQPTVDGVRSILSATRNASSRYPTVFSSILDLSQLRLHLYRRADFEKSALIDMRRELERGESRRPLSSFF